MTLEAGDSCQCCKCGISLPADKSDICSDICSACLKSEFIDLKQSLPPKQVTIQHCSQCDCYFHPPKLQMKARFGSKELMTFCVKSLKKMDFSLRNATFVGTETDYSETKIIKVKLSLGKDIWSVCYIEQDHIVEYLVEDETCSSCSGASSDLDNLVSSTL